MFLEFSRDSGSDSEIEIKRKKTKKASDDEDKGGKERPEEEDIFGEDLADLSDDDDAEEAPEREVELNILLFLKSMKPPALSDILST